MKHPKARQLPQTRQPTSPGGRQRQRDAGEIRHGTIGWQDGSDHFDLEPEGVPMLKVTLFAGHNTELQGQNTDPKRARGLPILVRFNGRMTDIPADGTHVIVVRPADMETTPGSYFLLQTVENDPKLVPNRKPAEKIIYGPKDSFIRFKEDGSIINFVASNDEENAPPVFSKLSKEGWEVRHPHGRARCDKFGFEMAHSSGAAISGGAVSGAPPPLDAFASFLNLRAAMVKVEAAAIALGPDSASPDMLVKATPTLAAFAALGAALTALNSALGYVAVDLSTIFTFMASGVPTPAPSVAFITTANAALAACTAPIAVMASPVAATSACAGG